MTADPPNVPEGWTSETISANGIDIQYVRTGGEGPPLVIAHGVYDDALCREPLIEDLSGEYDVIAYDARGHGRSSAPESGYSVGEQAEDLAGLLDAIGVDRPILLGHSMGGDIVASFAAEHPDRVRALVLVDPAGMLDHDIDFDPVTTARKQIQAWQDHSKAELIESDPGISAFAEAGQKRLAERLADACLRVDPAIVGVFEAGWIEPRETYPEIDAPTLILKADADTETRKHDRDIAAELHDGRLVHVENAGHTVFRDEREAATRELWAFLDSV